MFDSLTVTYDLEFDEPTETCGTVQGHLNASFQVEGRVNATFFSTPILGRRSTTSRRAITGGQDFSLGGGVNVEGGGEDLAADDGWSLSAGGGFNATSNASGGLIPCPHLH